MMANMRIKRMTAAVLSVWLLSTAAAPAVLAQGTATPDEAAPLVELITPAPRKSRKRKRLKARSQ